MNGLRVGIIGYGVVGTGVARVLLASDPPIAERAGIGIELVRVADVDVGRDRGFALPKGMLVSDADAILEDPSIGATVHTIGGIEPERTHILKALSGGKDVVTANKALLATHARELFGAALKAKRSISFEGSVGGGIPIIEALRDGLAANRIESVIGIVNGTANYVLTRMLADGAPYSQALAEAQRRGYAERDPAFDVGGLDSAHKLALLADISFQTLVDVEDIHVEGITDIALEDILHARELGYAVKLLAIGKRHPDGLELRVNPTLLPERHPLAFVSGVFNGILLTGDAAGETMFYGQGAGQMPTASAVVADLVAVARGTARQTFGKLAFLRSGAPAPPPVVPIDRIESRYYIRFAVEDRHGVLGGIASILGENEVSIASVVQRERHGGAVPIVILTHKAVERNVRKALAAIDRQPYVGAPSRFIRVEE